MNLSHLKNIRIVCAWLASKMPFRRRKNQGVRQLVQYHPFMFGKL